MIKFEKLSIKPAKYFLIVFLLFVFSNPAIVSAEQYKATAVSYHKVKFVYDGDTLLLDNGEKVRLLGINAPEIDYKAGNSEFMAHAARRFSRELLKGEQVRLEYDSDRKDRYGRLLAYVFLKNGTMVNEVLVLKGLAHVMFNRRTLKYRALLLDCQRKALKDKCGIWGAPAKKNEKIYLGNKISLRFHRPHCHFGKKISKKNCVMFKARRNAFWEGFSPCKQCCP